MPTKYPVWKIKHSSIGSRTPSQLDVGKQIATFNSVYTVERKTWISQTQCNLFDMVSCLYDIQHPNSSTESKLQ